MQPAPEHEVPTRPMPDAGHQEDHRHVEGPAPPASATERNIEVVAEPLAQGDMPPTPELRRARGAVGTQEVERQPDSQAPGDAHGDEAVAGEVVVDAQAEQDVGQPDLVGVGAGTPLKLCGQVVGEGALEEQPQRHPAEPGIEVGGRPPQAEPLDLRQQGLAALDGSGHDLREESGEVQEVEPAGQRLPADEGVHGEPHELEGVERDARRDGHRARP